MINTLIKSTIINKAIENTFNNIYFSFINKSFLNKLNDTSNIKFIRMRSHFAPIKYFELHEIVRISRIGEILMIFYNKSIAVYNNEDDAIDRFNKQQTYHPYNYSINNNKITQSYKCNSINKFCLDECITYYDILDVITYD